MTAIQFKDVLHQLIEDLIGKDSYRGVTLTYSWLANQFGHFSLGFIPTLIAYFYLKKIYCVKSALWAAIIISSLWLLFEIYNFLGPLLFYKQSKSKLLYVPEDKYVFQPAWWNVAFDTITDLLFFWFGAFWASLFLQISPTVIYILIIDAIILIYPVTFWFVTKIYLQYARLPTQFRLSQWKGSISEEDKKTVLAYLSKSQTSIGNHLLIYGGRRSGKSPLAIGVATELSIKRCPSSYYTGIKLYNLFSLTDQEIIDSEKCDKWSWRTASLLIIDDINSGSPIIQNLITPTQFIQLIDTTATNIDNRKELANKNVIWVLGDFGVNTIMDWKEMIEKVGVPNNMITSVNLSFNMI